MRGHWNYEVNTILKEKLVPVSFVVDDTFHVLNWHYSDKGDKEATEQCIQDWLDRYFTL